MTRKLTKQDKETILSTYNVRWMNKGHITPLILDSSTCYALFGFAPGVDDEFKSGSLDMHKVAKPTILKEERGDAVIVEGVRISQEFYKNALHTLARFHGRTPRTIRDKVEVYVDRRTSEEGKAYPIVFRLNGVGVLIAPRISNDEVSGEW